MPQGVGYGPEIDEAMRQAEPVQASGGQQAVAPQGGGASVQRAPPSGGQQLPPEIVEIMEVVYQAGAEGVPFEQVLGDLSGGLQGASPR